MSIANLEVTRLVALRKILKEMAHFVPTDIKDASLVVIHNSETGNIVTFERADGEDGIICGGVDEGEGLIDAAVREAKEECGLEIDEEDTTYLFSMLAPGGKVMVHCYYYDVAKESDPEVFIGEEFATEGKPVWNNPLSFLDDSSGKFKDFNTVLLSTIGLT